MKSEGGGGPDAQLTIPCWLVDILKLQLRLRLRNMPGTGTEEQCFVYTVMLHRGESQTRHRTGTGWTNHKGPPVLSALHF